jgi:hypothetical protein
MSADATGDGEALGAGVEEESPKLAPSDLLAATSTIAAVDKSPLGVMSNTLCLKLGRFGVEECPGAIFEGDQGGIARQGQGQRGERKAKGNAAKEGQGQRVECECGQGEGDEGEGGDNEDAQRCTAKAKMHKEAQRSTYLLDSNFRSHNSHAATLTSDHHASSLLHPKFKSIISPMPISDSKSQQTQEILPNTTMH